MMKRRQPLILALGAALAFAGGVSIPQVSAAVESPVAGAVASSEVTGEVTVVNTETRMMTIRTPSGVFEVLNIPESVKDIDDIEIGDEVTITATESVLVGIDKTQDVQHSAAIATQTVGPSPGDTQGARVVTDVTLHGKVESVDPESSSVTVRGTEGATTLRVRDPSLIADLEPGDAVNAHYMRVVTGEIKD